MPHQPSVQTIKRLFAESGNICAFPKCTQPIVNGSVVVGEVCHIKGNKPNSPRYDKAQSDEERHGYDNLVLMCGMHHTVIDSDEKSYSVERLLEIKGERIRIAQKVPDEEAERGAQILFSSPTLSINQTKGIAAGANASSGSIHFAPVIQVGNVGAPSAPSGSSPKAATEREKTRPRGSLPELRGPHIEVLAVETRPIHVDEDEIWRIGQLPGWRALAFLLPFYLDPKKSSPGARVEYAMAHLVFVSEAKVKTRIAHGCWVNASLDYTEMRPGDTKYLIPSALIRIDPGLLLRIAPPQETGAVIE